MRATTPLPGARRLSRQGDAAREPSAFADEGVVREGGWSRAWPEAWCDTAPPPETRRALAAMTGGAISMERRMGARHAGATPLAQGRNACHLPRGARQACALLTRGLIKAA